ncbi:glycosyltransferase [Geodermatophilus arenarius]|uniref:Glycosyltransferase family 4 protein n=1 Tax=Geodermatophilus arenarius TaxID=1137990 RepID=A0ABV9LI88_9ACTN
MHVLKHAVRGNGHVHVAVDLACAQADAGHDVTFASARGSYDDLLREHGVRVVDVPEATGGPAAVRSGWALLRLAHRTRPEIMHAHMMSSAVLAYPVAKVTGAVLVTTVHNSFDAHSNLMRLGKVVVAVSEAERQALITKGFPPRKVVAVLNGAARSPRESLPLDDIGPLARPCVLSLSGIHPRKAVGDIISAFAEVHPEFPDWHLNVVGWGPEREALEARVADLSLTDSVHFMGSTLTPKPLLEAADVFASASLADPCPLTTTEARAAGCAIVATSVGGVPEVLDRGRAGQLVPPQDPPAMAAAFRRLMGDPAELAAWQDRARKGSEYLTVERVAADYEQVYRSVL